MRGFILAAGFGTRLRPITNHIPKALVPVCGKVLLEHALEKLTKLNIETIGVNSHYLTEQIEAYKGKTSCPFEIFREDDRIRGTGGALYFARNFLGREDSFFVMNVDILSDLLLNNIIDSFLKSSSVCTLVAFDAQRGKGTILYDKDSGQYVDVANRDNRRENLAEADFVGMALYRKEFLNFLTPSDFSVVPVWKRAVESGAEVTVSLLEKGYWKDVGTLKSLADIHFDVIDGLIKICESEGMVIDKEKKICIPENANSNVINSCGIYSWVEQQLLPSGCHIKESVVFKNSLIQENRQIIRSLVTPWGVIPFDDKK